MKTKIIISVRGGVVESVKSTEEIEYCVIDHDNLESGEDGFFGNQFDFYSQDAMETEQEMFDELLEVNNEYEN